MICLSIINPELFKSWELYVFAAFGAVLFLRPKWFLGFFRFGKKIFMPKIVESYPDWAKSPKGAIYLAQDDDGIWRWHNRKPKLINGKWVSNEFAAMNMAGYTKPSDFANSIQKRGELIKFVSWKIQAGNYEYRNRHGEVYTFSMFSENILAIEGVFDFIRCSYDENEPNKITMIDPPGGPFLIRDMVIDENTNTRIDFFEKKDATKYLIHLK